MDLQQVHSCLVGHILLRVKIKFRFKIIFSGFPLLNTSTLTLFVKFPFSPSTNSEIKNLNLNLILTCNILEGTFKLK